MPLCLGKSPSHTRTGLTSSIEQDSHLSVQTLHVHPRTSQTGFKFLIKTGPKHVDDDRWKKLLSAFVEAAVVGMTFYGIAAITF